MTAFRAGLRSHTGQVRTTNQDLGVVGTTAFAVADGMGGHLAGEVASRIAIEAFSREPIETLGDLLDRVQDANRSIFEQSATDTHLRGMGTKKEGLILKALEERRVLEQHRDVGAELHELSRGWRSVERNGSSELCEQGTEGAALLS